MIRAEWGWERQPHGNSRWEENPGHPQGQSQEEPSRGKMQKSEIIPWAGVLPSSLGISWLFLFLMDVTGMGDRESS